MHEQNLVSMWRAILNADDVGFSLLTADDEVTTIRTITSYRALMKSLIRMSRPWHGGSLKKGGAR